MRLRSFYVSFYVPKSRAIMLAVALAILLAGTAKAVPALPAQQQQPSKAKPEPKKEKKVWTDENIGELGGKSRVSVVGQGKASGSTNGEWSAADADKAAAKSTGSIPEKDPQWYRAKLAPLRADIERTDAEIRRMKEFLAGGHTAEGRLELNRFSVPLNPANRIEELEKHKREVQSKIDEIEDEARRNSIAPGDIR